VVNAVPGWKRDTRVRNRQAWRDLEFLATVPEESLWLPLKTPAPTITATTDASSRGWGVTLGNEEISGVFPSDMQCPIATKEFLAILYGLEKFQDKLHGQVVRLMVDNQAVLHIIRKGASISADLMGILRQVQDLCRRQNITLLPEYIQSRMNIRADALSRLIAHTEWCLSDKEFKQLEKSFGHRQVDRFATSTNRKCAQFNCLTSHPNSLGDAWSTPWKGYRNYLCPPFALLQQVVARLKADQAEAVLVAPRFHSAPWWPTLLSTVCCIKELTIPQTDRAVIAPPGILPEPRRNPRWRLVICYIPGQDPATPPSTHYCVSRSDNRLGSSIAKPGANI
jgi:hypothetical protein